MIFAVKLFSSFLEIVFAIRESDDILYYVSLTTKSAAYRETESRTGARQGETLALRIGLRHTANEPIRKAGGLS
jgi:hypothetical protein